MKISQKMDQYTQQGHTFFSFEFFPPRTDEGVENLFERQDRMAAYGPTFCDITWGAGGSTAELTLEIADKMQNMVCVETMMHLTCTNMPAEKLDDALRKLKECGIQNVLALRGDPPKGEETFKAVEGGFGCALDLVKYIRKQHGEHFGITVSGYPEAHPDVITDNQDEQIKAYHKDIDYLKQKVDAGSDLVITQLFYDVEQFLRFVQDCRAAGIRCPIIPGIMPIQTYNGFKRMTGFCKVKVPQEITDTLEGIKDNDEAVRNFGVDLGVKMCRRMLEAGTPGLHMYTLNLEGGAVTILERLGLIDKSKVPRQLPWRRPTNSKRLSEDVRPIHWSNRPKSYLSRTADWDSFPSGRWGNARSPAYGTLSDYQFMRPHSREKRQDRQRTAWGQTLGSVQDVINVFVRYCQGEVDLLPWSEMSSVMTETAQIAPQLTALNARGFLTINSQPRVNGAPSEDPHVGWGGPHGYVYQKAYIEFFCSPESFQQLRQRLDKAPTVTYMAVNAAGESHMNVQPGDVNAVTWGVFPAKEIMQPTVVDPQSFGIWKDEAFQLWTAEWASLYPKDSKSHEVLTDLALSWYLVSVVDNDFVHGNIFQYFPQDSNGKLADHAAA